MQKKVNLTNSQVVGLMPAGGKGSRIAPLPCSKELFPLGFQSLGRDRGLRPKPVCLYLLEGMRKAGVKKVFIILRDGKWDIPAYLGDGKMLDLKFAYLMMDLPFGVPYTLDQAYPFVSNASVVFGFPDIIFQPKDALARLLVRQKESKADAVLGLFPARHPHRMDMVDLDQEGRILDILVKPIHTTLNYTWIIAVWTRDFTKFIHESVAAGRARDEVETGRADPSVQEEVFLGDVFRAAVHQGMIIESVIFEQGKYVDIGTPEELAEVTRATI